MLAQSSPEPSRAVKKARGLGSRMSNRLLKKPKAADKKEEAEDIVDWKKKSEEKSAECAALKSQVVELQQNSVSIVEALSKNQETFCKVSITALYEGL